MKKYLIDYFFSKFEKGAMRTLFFKIALLMLILFLGLSCRRNREDDSGPNNLGIIALLAASAGSLPANATVATALANGVSLSSEDSGEAGSMGESNTANVRAVSATNTSGIASGPGSVWNLTLTNETLNCPLGGTITYNGAQTVTVASSTDFWNKTTTLTSGNRTITYNSCVVSSTTTINSGTLTHTQITPATGTTTMQTSGNITFGTGTLTRLLSNWQGTTTGTINLTFTGSGGNSATGNATFNLTTNLTSRTRTWNLNAFRFSNPQLVSRSGTITGTVVIGNNTFTINRSLDLTTSN